LTGFPVIAGHRSPWPAVAGRYAVVGLGALLLGALHLRHRPATLCLFRAVTGLPCPFCGGTTAVARLGRGDILGAVVASPLAVVLLAGWPVRDVLHPPAWWQARWQSRPLRWGAGALLLVTAELWQLVRFGVVPRPW
jgi:hypothetical protein